MPLPTFPGPRPKQPGARRAGRNNVFTKHVVPIAVAVLVTACTTGARPTPSPAPTGSSGSPPPSAAGSVPIAIPDPSRAFVHRAGEPVRVGDATVVFRGLQRHGSAVVASFELTAGSLEGAELLVGRTRYPLVAHGTRLETGPIDAAAGIAPDAELTLISGRTLTVFAAGPVR